MPNKTTFSQKLLASSVLVGVAAMAAPSVAMAQDGEPDVIQVTGSRIHRTDTVAVSPVTAVSAEQLAIVNTVNTEDFLNTLPQIVPAFDASSNNPGNGTATVNLRGLGTVRTLVLVNGRRFVGSGPAQIVDLNNVPAALVERVDVVTGGASAVYGSDAVAGVVNFVLKDDFEGVEMSASTEFSLGDLDGQITSFDMTMGGNFDNGRGNAVISLGYTNRESILQGDRDASALTYWDPGAGNAATGFILGGSTNIPGTRFRGATSSNFGLTTAEVEAIDPNCINNGCSGLWVDSSGTVRALRLGPFGGGTDTTTDFYNYAPDNYLQVPQERYNISAFATYEVNEHLEFYANGVFANNVVDAQLAPTPTGTLTMDINLDNPLIPAVLLASITGDAGSNNGDGTATIRFNRRMEEVGFRNGLRDTSSYQLLVGARGDINDNWAYDVYANFSRSSVAQIIDGNISVAATQEALLCDGGPTAILSGCTAPALNIFGGPGSVSDAAAAHIRRTGAQIDDIDMFQAMATVSGELHAFGSPLAEYDPAIVLGVEYREANARSVPDSVLGPDVRGFNSSLPVAGVVDVYEFFTEVEVPLVSGRPMMESLTFNGAFRSSTYNTVGNVETYAAGLGWEVNDQIRVRGNFNRAVRAPNVNELFAAFTNGFPGATDPCAGGGFGSFSAATNVASCVAAGVPAGLVGDPSVQSNGQIEGLFGGNPNLGVETADTLTVGVVLQPEMIPGLTVQLDYYDISIEGAITTVPLQTLLNDCHISNVAAACAALAGGRNPATGEMASPFRPSLGGVNIGAFDTEGVDLRVDYRFGADVLGLGDGDISVMYYGGFTIASDTLISAASGVVTCAGEFGLECGEPTPEYKHTVQTSWYDGPFTVSLRWRYIDAVIADTATFPLVSTLSDDIEAKNYFDVTFSYDITDNFNLTTGITNVTDVDVPILGTTSSEQGNTWPATYETLGRRLFLGGTMRF
jgi:iron complex outermembrane receptor protein